MLVLLLYTKAATRLLVVGLDEPMPWHWLGYADERRPWPTNAHLALGWNRTRRQKHPCARGVAMY
jgi:hypothetical protein